MGVVAAVGLALLVLVVTFGVRRYDPTVVRRLSRELGVGPRVGWAAYALWLTGLVLPVALGARVTDEAVGWPVGGALYTLGCYLVVVAVTSRDELAALRAATVTAPEAVRPVRPGSSEAVATAGRPSVDGDATAPFSGAPAVHADWLVQVRDRAGLRRVWQNCATGVEARPFALADGAVWVDPADARAFTGETTIVSVGPDEALPDRVREFLATRDDLPDPDDRDRPLRFVEERVPADGPVTVVGTPRAGERGTVVDEGPPDEAFGSDGTSGPGGAPVLVAGDAEAARSHLERRVRWLGAAGVALVAVGQAVAFALSPASRSRRTPGRRRTGR